MLPIMERLGLAAMTGHWEFAYGPEHLTALSQALPYPFLAANVYEKDGDRLVFPPVTRVHLVRRGWASWVWPATSWTR